MFAFEVSVRLSQHLCWYFVKNAVGEAAATGKKFDCTPLIDFCKNRNSKLISEVIAKFYLRTYINWQKLFYF